MRGIINIVYDSMSNLSYIGSPETTDDSSLPSDRPKLKVRVLHRQNVRAVVQVGNDVFPRFYYFTAPSRSAVDLLGTLNWNFATRILGVVECDKSFFSGSGRFPFYSAPGNFNFPEFVTPMGVQVSDERARLAYDKEHPHLVEQLMRRCGMGSFLEPANVIPPGQFRQLGQRRSLDVSLEYAGKLLDVATLRSV